MQSTNVHKWWNNESNFCFFYKTVAQSSKCWWGCLNLHLNSQVVKCRFPDAVYIQVIWHFLNKSTSKTGILNLCFYTCPWIWTSAHPQSNLAVAPLLSWKQALLILNWIPLRWEVMWDRLLWCLFQPQSNRINETARLIRLVWLGVFW